MINNAMSGWSSVIRKITRGTISSNWKGEYTISCSITDPNKVIVLLDYAGTYIVNGGSSYTNSNDICLKSVSNNSIILYRSSNAVSPYKSGYIYSYQIIEFM